MEIRKSATIGQYGLFSTKQFDTGDIVHTLTGPLLLVPTRESIHVGDNKHIVDLMGSFMNHSFTPNTFIRGTHVVASKSILPGDELTFNYNHSELKMACPFVVDGRPVTGN